MKSYEVVLRNLNRHDINAKTTLFPISMNHFREEKDFHKPLSISVQNQTMHYLLANFSNGTFPDSDNQLKNYMSRSL